MVTPRQGKQSKKRITEEKITDMKRLYLEGMTISAIAEKLGVHRQTVTGYVAPKKRDIVADDVRKQLLADELRNHFNQLNRFIREDIRKQLNASAPGETAVQETISTAGVLGFPYSGAGAPRYITDEWNRMYTLPPREQHLLKSIRQHTRDSKLWVHWNQWRKKVAPFEGASRALWEWLGDKLEVEPPDDIRDIETVRSWVFGNIIRIAGDREPAVVETLKQSARPGGFIPAVYSNPSNLSRYALKILEEARGWPDLGTLRSAMSELADSKSQAELRRLAGNIDFVLAGIELMNAFPGRCEICPV